MDFNDKEKSEDDPSILSIDDQNGDDKPLYILAEEFEEETKKESPKNENVKKSELSSIPLPLPGQTSETVIICKACGAHHDLEDKFCMRCGEKLG